MALSVSQWEKVKAMFELGVALNEIAKETKIDKGSVSRKAKQEGWVKGKMQPTVAKEVQARQALKEVDAEKATLNATERVAIDAVVAKRLHHLQFFETANLLVAKTAANKLQRDGINATYQDVNAAASAILKAQEGVLGKNPDTVINNTNAVQVVQHTPEQLRKINQDLEDAC